MRRTRGTAVYMGVGREIFGEFEGRPVSRFILDNGRGCRAKLIDFGARLTEMHVPGRDGNVADVVLGFDGIESYRTTDTYFGATCGRYGNRIRDGRFQLGQEAYQLTANEESNHIHGGFCGFDKHVWDAYCETDENAVTFTLVSPDGEEGYPGALLLKSRYVLTDDNRLLVTMSGTADRATILNMVHHSYWNMAGHASGDIRNQHLAVNEDFYTPVDGQLLATGEILSIAGTPFDFREAKPIGQDIDDVPSVAVGHLAGGGYDHNWVLRGAPWGLTPVATLYDPTSGRGFELSSTEPGVQIYTGGYLSDAVIGKDGSPYCTYAGLTFETQKFPGSPNFSHFPTTRLNPGEVYEHRMKFRFFAR